MVFFDMIVSLCQRFVNILSCIFNYLWEKGIIESVIIAIIASLLFTIIWEKLTAPKLEITKDEDWGTEYSNDKLMYYHLNVKNKRTFYCGARKPAMSCKIEIEVFKKDGTKINLYDKKGVKFYARWTSHPVPDSREIGSLTLLKNDVYGHEKELIPIVIKYKGESCCYMFNNESYLHFYKKGDFKEPLFHLDDDEFYLMLKAYYKKRPVVHFFKLTNTGTCYEQLELKKLCSYTYLWLLCLHPCKFKYRKVINKCLKSKECSEQQRPQQIDLAL